MGSITASISEAARAAVGQYARSFRFLGEPVAMETPAGYTTWHTVGQLPVILGIWAVLAGARLVRGEEERGSLDLLLATPHSRARLLGEKSAALVAALGLIALLIGLGRAVGEAVAGLPVDAAGALLTGLNASLTALVFGLLALLLAQVLGHRAAAAGWAGALLVLSYFLNGTGRIVEHGIWLQRLSPLYYHDLSKPLIATYGSNVGAFTVLVVLSLGLAGASLLLFLRRDIGGTTLPAWHIRRPGERPGIGIRALEQVRHDPFVRPVARRALRAEAPLMGWWLVGVVVLIAWITLIARDTKDAIAQILASAPPALAQVLGELNLRTDTGYIAAIAVLYLPVLLALFALTLAVAWPNDLESGRLELVLATPQPRWRLVLERFGVVGAAALTAPLVSWLALLASARIAGLDVEAGRFAVAFLGIVPLELITGAAVYALAGWLRAGGVVALAGAVVALSYFAELLNPLLKLPDGVVSLSIFHQYGNPLVEEPRWGAWLALAGIAAILLALGAFRFSRADVPQRA